jgi:hypothetical protein
MMSTAQKFYPRNTLAAMINRPGGITIADALSRAEANVETIRGDCLAAIDEALAAVQGLIPANGAPSPDAVNAMYQYANDIVGVAVTYDLRELSRAAYSLCELLDRQRARDAWSARAVSVHIEALRLLREPNADADGRAAILVGLEQVLAVAAR